MENRILTMEGWEKRIQDKLGIDPAYLPDEVIRQPDCIDVAEANIISQIPDYSTLLDGDNKTYLEYTVVLECCILLCPGMSARLPIKEAGPHGNHELKTHWDNLKTELEEERNECIGKVYTIAFPNLPFPTLPHFTVTYPKREWQGK